MKQRLGQHFLTNIAAIEKIVAGLELSGGDTLIEIGPGHGELTGVLARGTWLTGPQSKIIAIEKDEKLAAELEKRFSENKNIEIVGGDALKILPLLLVSNKLKDKSLKLAGNIPYYITGHLLRKISESESKPKVSILTVQKEVAERIVAGPPNMNRLSASVQFWAKPTILARLAKTDFHPAPEVESAVIKFELVAKKRMGDAGNYYGTVRALFAQPRKTILNNLSSAIRGSDMIRGSKKIAPDKETISQTLVKIGISPEERPQDLDIEEIVKIAELLSLSDTED